MIDRITYMSGKVIKYACGSGVGSIHINQIHHCTVIHLRDRYMDYEYIECVYNDSL